MYPFYSVPSFPLLQYLPTTFDTPTMGDITSGEDGTASPSNMDKEGGPPEPTKEIARDIAAIDRSTVHQICSGQVVLNLATAVKELLENSIDAGATRVEIRLRDYGASSIEVADNGSGVEEENFQGLTLKHHTSKLREFQDLVGVETYGFRGEALSSLCALSDLSISTRHTSSTLGATIVYNHDSKMVGVNRTARPVGTTVILKNLFSTMPVRLKEFLRNIKKEFARLCQVLNAYCLVSTGVRIICSNTVRKGKKNIVMATQGDENVKDNIVSVFGISQSLSLRTLKSEELTSEELLALGIRSVPPEVYLTGFVSSCERGIGRGVGDRQFFYINSRPCDPPRIVKTVNEVYHQYNRSQYPFVYLDIRTTRTTVDVNVTPDKRQVFLQNEKYLCGLIKKCLESVFRDAQRSIPLNSTLQIGARHLEASITDPEETVAESEETLIRRTSMEAGAGNGVFVLGNFKRKYMEDRHAEMNKKSTTKQLKVDSFYRKVPVLKDPSFFGDVGDEDDVALAANTAVKNDCAPVTDRQDFPAITDSPAYIEERPNSELETQVQSLNFNQNEIQTMDFYPTKNKLEPGVNNMKEDRLTAMIRSNYSQPPLVIFDDFDNFQSQSQPKTSQTEIIENKPGFNIIFDKFTSLSTGSQTVVSTPQPGELEKYCNLHANQVDQEPPKVQVTLLDDSRKGRRRETSVVFSLHTLKQSLDSLLASPANDVDSLSFNPTSDEFLLRFSAKINPEDNRTAEKELQRQLVKSDFTKMKIFGQFNLGFIIVGLRQDLFIVDQHATDEKYNFETLQRSTDISSQRMVAPQHLQLTAVNESVLMDNLTMFEKNGFKFEIDETALPTQRVRLTALPISKNWTFGKEDIDELIFLLSESAERTVTRPSRVRAMFASRACRVSVMIGTSLSPGVMRRLIDHMGEIEQPWNCPHGRPTIRHLVNLALIN